MRFFFTFHKEAIYLLPSIEIDFDTRELNVNWLFWELCFDFWRE